MGLGMLVVATAAALLLISYGRPFMARRREQQAQLLADWKAGQAQLEEKATRLKQLRAEARGEERFLDPEYQRRYAYEHYDEVRSPRWTAKLEEYARWEADPDWEYLSKRLDLGRTTRVWEAKRDLRGMLGGVRQADREIDKDMEYSRYDAVVSELDRQKGR